MKAASRAPHSRGATAALTVPVVRKLKCAVYTRKSTEEGLDQEFNSLDAQREACEAYVTSQKAEGWLLVNDRYDDSGVSGGTLERPALKRLLRDIEAGRVDIVVVYKIDRLSRSLMDFARLVEVFERTSVTFVSITQSFNTTTSMGRLTLNVLLSFAQFEREVIGERIRDKVAASRKRGIWMGGWAPLGYDVRDRKLVINEAEAAVVRKIFRRFAQHGSGIAIVKELKDLGFRNKYGKIIDKVMVYRLLRNRTYIGDACHKGAVYPGEHTAIIERSLWDRVQAVLDESPAARRGKSRRKEPSLLAGLIFGPDGRAMSPSHTRRRGRLYRYYVSQTVTRRGAGSCSIGRVPAGGIETAILDQLRVLLCSPAITVATHRAARARGYGLNEGEVRDALQQLHALWAELFPAEQARIVHLLVGRVDVLPAGLDISMRPEGFAGLAIDLSMPSQSSDPATLDGGGELTDDAKKGLGLIKVHVPMRFRDMGSVRRIVGVEADSPATVEMPAKEESPQLRWIARAFFWKKQLASGEYGTLADLAAAEKFDRAKLSKVLALSLLAPDVISAFLDGEIPEDLTTERLLGGIPSAWDEQRAVLLAPRG